MGTAPAKLALGGAAAHEIGQLQIVIDQIPQYAAERTAAFKHSENQPDRALDAPVRVKRDFAGRFEHVAARRLVGPSRAGLHASGP